MVTPTTLVPVPSRLEDDVRLAEVLARSGAFKGLEVAGRELQARAALALAKIVVGREFGVGPAASLIGLDLVEGRPTWEYPQLLAFVRRSGRYDYEILHPCGDAACRVDMQAAEVRFLRLDGGQRRVEGVARFTIEDARRAGLVEKAAWRRYPAVMLLARAVSAGVKRFCPDVVGGGISVYAQGELGDEPVAVEARVLPPACDGEHPSPSCGDATCWQLERPSELLRASTPPSAAGLAAALGIAPGSHPLAPDPAPARVLHYRPQDAAAVACAAPALGPDGATDDRGAATCPACLAALEAAPAAAANTPAAGLPSPSPPSPAAGVLPADALTAVGLLGDDVEATPELANRVHDALLDRVGGVARLAWAHWEAAGVARGGARPTGRRLRALVAHLETRDRANGGPPAKAPRGRRGARAADAEGRTTT